MPSFLSHQNRITDLFCFIIMNSMKKNKVRQQNEEKNETLPTFAGRALRTTVYF